MCFEEVTDRVCDMLGGSGRQVRVDRERQYFPCSALALRKVSGTVPEGRVGFLKVKAAIIENACRYTAIEQVLFEGVTLRRASGYANGILMPRMAVSV